MSRKELLVLHCEKDSIVTAQLEPFVYSKRYLERHYGTGIAFQKAETLEDSIAFCLTTHAKYVFLVPFWDEKPETAEHCIREIRVQRPDLVIAFVGPWAQANSSYFSLLPVVDLFLKRQCYRRRDDYFTKYAGGNVFTDYLEKERGYDLDGWYMGSPVPPGHGARILPGWNLGTANYFRESCVSRELKPSPKTIDIFCRVSLGAEDREEWYRRYRTEALEAIGSLQGEFDCAVSGGFTGAGLVPMEQYYTELRESRIVVSPFGWGETCRRDFEAVCHGCLLVKPDMSHIETLPDIFQAGVTYAPCQWNFSDLTEIAHHYLRNESARRKVVANAYQRLRSYFTEHHFPRHIANLLGLIPIQLRTDHVF